MTICLSQIFVNNMSDLGGGLSSNPNNRKRRCYGNASSNSTITTLLAINMVLMTLLCNLNYVNTAPSSWPAALPRPNDKFVGDGGGENVQKEDIDILELEQLKNPKEQMQQKHQLPISTTGTTETDDDDDIVAELLNIAHLSPVTFKTNDENKNQMNIDGNINVKPSVHTDKVDENLAPKPFLGAARLTMGHNSEPHNPEILLIRHRGGEVSSLDMAQYVFWTGDEEGIAKAVEEFIQKGLMSRENAIKLLRDISMGIEYLENVYAKNRLIPAHRLDNYEETIDNNQLFTSTITTTQSPQQQLTKIHIPTTKSLILTNKLANQIKAAKILKTTTTTLKPKKQKMLQTTQPASAVVPSSSSTDSMEKSEQYMPTYFQLNEISKKGYENNDAISNRNIRLADCLYTAYSLEVTIYQMAKLMFYQSLSTGSAQAQQSLKKLTQFLQTRSKDGFVAPAVQKHVLEVLLQALADCLTEHPHLIKAARKGLGEALDILPKNVPYLHTQFDGELNSSDEIIISKKS